jgi:choline dehydrogenase-like flavoprotein
MIADAHDIEPGTSLLANLCIVGAGAAGIALALQFETSRMTVLLLESGGETEEDATQTLYEGATDARLHPPLHTYRRRAFGGSTAIWGGRCVPFDPIDFEKRPWMPASGWPFGYDTLLPYYRDASRLCETGDFAYTDHDAFPKGMRQGLRNFHGRQFTDAALERFSCPTDFARRYRARLAAAGNITVLLHANVTELRTARDGTVVQEAIAATLSGKRFSVKARRFVLAAGGLEIPRLLLASRDNQAHGIGNAHDQVGRYYMTHLAGTIGELIPRSRDKAFFNGYVKADDGAYCRRRFALTEAAQRSLRTGNFIARPHHPRLRDPSHRTAALSAIFLAKPFISFEYARRLHGDEKLSPREWLMHARNLLCDMPGLARFGCHWTRDRVLAERKFPSLIIAPRSGRYSLDFHAEQAPNPESRVRLGRDTDALGMPRLIAEWRPTPFDMHTIRTALAALATEIGQSGEAELTYNPDDVEYAALRDGAYGGHHIGTARMSSSPRNGVVDENGAVHGMKNLFIAGSAVFPTSSQANPTLTIVALTLRLAAHLQRPAVALC